MEEKKKDLTKETSELTRLNKTLAQQQDMKNNEVQRLAYEVDKNMENQYNLDKAMMVNYQAEAEEQRQSGEHDSFRDLKFSQKLLHLDMPKLPTKRFEKASEKGHQALLDELKGDLHKLASFLEIPENELLKSQAKMLSTKRYESSRSLTRILGSIWTIPSARYLENSSPRTAGY